MPPEHADGELDGAGGVRLFWQGWLPARPPNGVVLICHGLGEHSGRYRTVVDALLPDGWAVYGLDLRGHGRSSGRRAHLDRYAHWLADVDAMRGLAVGRHPDLPVFLLGHSMGGQIALAYALQQQGELAGLVLSAPALASTAVPRAAVPALRGLARLAPPAASGRHRPNEDQQGSGGGGRLPGRSAGAPRQPDAGAVRGAVHAVRGAARRARELRLPVLLQHGLLDELTDPAGSRRLAAELGSPDRTVHWYRGPVARDLPRAGARGPAGRPSGLARRAPLNPSDICVDQQGPSRALEPDWPTAGPLCSDVRMPPAAILGEIWGCRRADHFDQCCCPS